MAASDWHKGLGKGYGQLRRYRLETLCWTN
jgi:hypothetical protein